MFLLDTVTLKMFAFIYSPSQKLIHIDMFGLLQVQVNFGNCLQHIKVPVIFLKVMDRAVRQIVNTEKQCLITQ